MSELIITERSKMVALADGVRSKTGNTNLLNINEMIDGVYSITGNGGINTSDATATSSDILDGKTAYANGQKVTGTMVNHGSISFTISSKSQSYTIPAGYYSGSGNVSISSDEQNKIIASNIKSGVSILGVDGAYEGDGGLDTSDATAAAADILNGKTAYVNGIKITGSIETKTSDDLMANGAIVNIPSGYYASDVSKSVSTTTQATPSISVSDSGLITASATQTEGYVNTGTKSATNQLATQGAKTITPTNSSQTAVDKGMYTTGAVIVDGDSNLVSSNIKKDVSIFGITGTYIGIDTSDATAKSADIKEGVTAYVNGEKITGTMIIPSVYDGEIV